MSEQAIHNTREIRSYVLRGGRITDAQRRALQELWPRFGLDFQPAPLDLDALFGRDARRTIEIGFGNGAHLLARAAAEPQHVFIGIEVHRPGVGRALLGAAQLPADNLRVINHDAVDVLSEQIPPDSIDEVQILFPDPWHKKRHHKRRLIQPRFVDLLASRLHVGGVLHVATDWEPYAQHISEVLRSCEALENVAAGDFAERPESRIVTRFERRGTQLGHTVRDLIWRRRF